MLHFEFSAVLNINCLSAALLIPGLHQSMLAAASLRARVRIPRAAALNIIHTVVVAYCESEDPFVHRYSREICGMARKTKISVRVCITSATKMCHTSHYVMAAAHPAFASYFLLENIVPQ